jgi:hypothetical protein
MNERKESAAFVWTMAECKSRQAPRSRLALRVRYRCKSHALSATAAV